MKKILLLLFVCTVSTHLIAQKNETGKIPPEAPSALSTNDIAPPPPLPPSPPPPPAPPALPEKPEQVKFNPPVIVNEKGYDISVHYNNGNNMVYIKKKGLKEKISLEKWNANQSFYENKYGKLPQPPPPPAPPAPPTPSEN